MLDVERVSLAQRDKVPVRQVKHILLALFEDLSKVLLNNHLAGACNLLIVELKQMENVSVETRYSKTYDDAIEVEGHGVVRVQQLIN